MLILTHDGPGFRSRLLDREAALARAAELQQDPRYSGVVTLESTRASHRERRFFVVCLPVDPEQRARLLARFQEERRARAEQEGPAYLWAPHPEQPAWHLLSQSGELYTVAPEAGLCSCRDAGVCRDNGLRCKHLVAFEQGLGRYLHAEVWAQLQLLAEKVNTPAAERQPVAVPVAA